MWRLFFIDTKQDNIQARQRDEKLRKIYLQPKKKIQNAKKKYTERKIWEREKKSKVCVNLNKYKFIYARYA